MKTRNLLLLAIFTVFFSGCVLFSFYPLYTENDLFENDILTGNWISNDDNMKWKFTHPVYDNQNKPVTDNKSYKLEFTDYDSIKTEYFVNVIQLKGMYFLDFYLEEVKSDRNSKPEGNITLWNLHLMPVHTFAKLTVNNDTLQINWFDGDWIKDQINAKKLKIRHEYDGDNLLLTAKTSDLQKLVLKYANAEEAFKDGLNVTLTKY